MQQQPLRILIWWQLRIGWNNNVSNHPRIAMKRVNEIQ